MKLFFKTLALACLTTSLSAQTFLLQESFEGSTFPPTGWSIYTPTGNYADGWTNGPQSGLLSGVCVPHGSKTMTSQWTTYYPNATWAFTPGLSLSAGTTYVLSFKQCVQSPSSNKTESLKITAGTQASASAQTITLLDLPTLNNTSPQSRSASFTPTLSGVYYFAFNCYSAANQRYLSIDSVNIYTNTSTVSFPSPYCATSFTQGIEPVTLVNFAGINNNSSASNTSPAHENYTAITGTVQTNQTYTITVKGNTNGAQTSYVKAWFDWNQNNVFDATEEYTLGTLYNSTGTDAVLLTRTISIPGNAVLGNTRMRIIKKAAVYPVSACNNDGSGQAEDYSLTITGVTSLSVSTQGNVPAYITTNGGTLQMASIVYPSTMNQAVTWSIVPGSGNASITSGGLVNGLSNGNVWAKAVSVADITKKDSLQITIINQTVAAAAINIKTQNLVPATITTNHGTLQMVATITPTNASQAAIWSIVPVSGNASVNSTGLITASKNGTVWVKARAQANQTLADSMLITISGQLSTGTNELLSDKGIVLFPNPAAHECHIYTTQKHPALSVSLYDLTGRILSKNSLAENSLNTSYSINLSGLSTGLYLVEIKGENVFMLQKIVKE